MDEDKLKKTASPKRGDDLGKTIENFGNMLTKNEFSRVTGVRLELLRRFINRQARSARKETWDKIYPALKPLLEEPLPAHSLPQRVGPGYRHHKELVEMFSDQKVLLDEFAVLSDVQKQQAVKAFQQAAHTTEVSNYKSLSDAENAIMGAFLAMEPAVQQTELLKLTDTAIAEVKRRRKG